MMLKSNVNKDKNVFFEIQSKINVPFGFQEAQDKILDIVIFILLIKKML